MPSDSRFPGVCLSGFSVKNEIERSGEGPGRPYGAPTIVLAGDGSWWGGGEDMNDEKIQEVESS